MENKYLYIDDDNHDNAVEKIDGFLSEDLIIETVQHSNSWEELHIPEHTRSLSSSL